MSLRHQGSASVRHLPVLSSFAYLLLDIISHSHAHPPGPVLRSPTAQKSMCGQGASCCVQCTDISTTRYRPHYHHNPTIICQYHHHNHHLSPSSVTISITTTTICHYHHNRHYHLSISSRHLMRLIVLPHLMRPHLMFLLLLP